MAIPTDIKQLVKTANDPKATPAARESASQTLRDRAASEGSIRTGREQRLVSGVERRA